MTRIGTGLSLAADASSAAADAAAGAASELGARGADLAFLFLTPQHLEQAEAAAAAVRTVLEPRHLLGCASEGVIAGERELEAGPATAVWAASLPGAEIDTFHVTAVADAESFVLDGVPELGEPTLVALLVDPFTFPTAALIERLNCDYPGVPLVGGIATGGGESGAQALIVGERVHSEGTAGVALAGIAVQAVVSQGCVPLGREAVITRAEGNVVFELAGRPALERLREILGALSARQRALAARGLLVGLVVDENKAEYERGDFLIRGILGVDEESGAIATGEKVRVGQTLCFHARDATSADEDLRLALQETIGRGEGRPIGALLFTCNGRGTRMFAEPDHDSRALSDALGAPALAGFFCGGEIGPVGGRSFLHGFTATMAVFLERETGREKRA